MNALVKKLQKIPKKKFQLENEREKLVEKLPLRERIKEFFKKYGFTVIVVLLAVGTTIGFLVDKLTKGVSDVTNTVSNGLKDLGKKIGSILPGLLGAIVSFVFRTAGQIISFLGKNA